MKVLELLNPLEKEMLFRAPAYVSLLAANADGEMDEIEKATAIEFAHVKTYSCNPLLTNFYLEVKRGFSLNIEYLDKQLPKGKEERLQAINQELQKLEPIIAKLGYVYAEALHKSFISYAEHISKAHRNILTSFFIPMHIKGLTT